MTPKQWQKARELFEAALAQHPAERDAFLSAVCEEEPEVLAEARNLLQAHEQAGSFLEQPVVRESTEEDPTLKQPFPELPQPSPRHAERPVHSSSPSGGRFVAGTMLAGRYRIISLLGQGGMGEVYKAEDLKLNQTVALKFLPEALALNGAMLARFHNEVRTARQITHPNVCRVHDIGETKGLHFISMEFIDGEDLSSLLKRIGRLPGDKAVEIARQICAGLSAAHESGVLHRDLKPANVMIDGRGKARITDFGIAVIAAELTGDEAIAGTPTYMAPEQLLGKEVTTKSDIYALGLVLYELFTGKRVYEAKAIHELIQLHEKSTPPTPSSHVKDIDPLAERVIMRCLEKDPQKRPASAMQVALALPGGDPLQAAIAAGETPSPEMVAASGGEIGLRPAVAVMCLVAVVIGLLAAAWMNGKTRLMHRIPFDNPPEVLAAKAREIASQFGYSNKPTDQVWDFAYNTEYLRYIEESDPSPKRWDQLQPQAIFFRYRESPHYFQPISDSVFRDSTAAVRLPASLLPASLSGMIDVGLDPQGRLLWFNAIPARVNEGIASVPDWAVLFRVAGLDLSHFTQSEPRWSAPTAFDTRIAWTGTSKEWPTIPLKVEAAAWQGKTIYFEIIYPWSQQSRIELFRANLALPIFLAIFMLISLLAAMLMAWSNQRDGKGDHLGAFKLACLTFFLYFLADILSSKYTPIPEGIATTLFRALAPSTYWAAVTWLYYFAFEPYVRRRWPTVLISWSRIITGWGKDALIGRDILIGTLGGIIIFILGSLRSFNTRFVLEARLGLWPPLTPLLGTRLAGGNFLEVLGISLRLAVTILFILLFLRILLRRQWLAAMIGILILAAFDETLAYSPKVTIPSAILYSLIFVCLTLRFGLVALLASLIANYLLGTFPISLNLTTWFAGTGILASMALLVLALWGFYTSLGGQKMFWGGLLEE